MLGDPTLEARVAALEAKEITVGDLPLKRLQDTLELNWLPDVVSAATGDASKENIANKGAANGYAALDSSGKVPASELPTLTSAVAFASIALFGSDA